MRVDIVQGKPTLRERRCCQPLMARQTEAGDDHALAMNFFARAPMDRTHRPWHSVARDQSVRRSTSMNPNKALWEKGDFTRIAAAMRESGEALVKSIGITKGLKVLDLGRSEERRVG